MVGHVGEKTSRLMLASHRELFEIPRDIAYFNNGSYTPLPRTVREAGEVGVATKSQPWSIEAEAARHQADLVRAAAARFIGATADDIAIVNAAAYGIATAAANLPIERGTRILLIAGEFPSQSLEWARRAEACGAVLDVVQQPGNGDWTAAIRHRIEAVNQPPIGIAALTPLVWTDGSLIDLELLAPLLRAQGAAIVVDATQAVGVLPIDVHRIGADYLVFPTYKWLLGPYTLAFMYVAPHRQHGIPIEQHNGNRAVAGVPFDGTLPPLIPSARRFDMGQCLNPVSLPMALAGMDLLHQWGRAPLAARLQATTDAIVAQAEALGFEPIRAKFRAPHLVGLRVAGGATAKVAADLAAAGVFVAERAGQLRVGAHIFNDEEDVARLADAARRSLSVRASAR